MKLKFSLNLFFGVLFCLNCALKVDAARLYPEKQYQTVWCSQNGGVEEVVLQDNTRVDCVLPKYAIEFDFANKWSEAVGQSLYYACLAQKAPGIVLIMENYQKDIKYLSRLRRIAGIYGITVWTMSPEDLKITDKKPSSIGAQHVKESQTCKRKTENY